MVKESRLRARAAIILLHMSAAACRLLIPEEKQTIYQALTSKKENIRILHFVQIKEATRVTDINMRLLNGILYQMQAFLKLN